MMKTVKDYIQIVNDEMARRFAHTNSSPAELYEPVSYILSNGGKRIRAVMVLLAADMFGGNVSKAMGTALAIEVFHNFTLLHDDIMDKAPLRRGMPTVHVKWNDNTAILSGDAMMIMANMLMMETPPHSLVAVFHEFNKVAMEVCEGQQYDMNLEKRHMAINPVGEAEYMNMIRLKTSVLIGASLKIGALCGGASADDAQILYNYGLNIGLAFQIQDDFLDTYGDEADFGKRIGGDILEGKKTYLMVKLVELASDTDRKEAERIIAESAISDDEKIKSIKHLYGKYGVDTITQNKISTLFVEAKSQLSRLGYVASACHALRELENMLISRNK